MASWILAVVLLAAPAPGVDAPLPPLGPVAPIEQLDGGAPQAAVQGAVAAGADGGAPELEAVAAAGRVKHTDWLAVPLLAYNSDTRLNFGVAGEIQWAGLVDPYRYQLAAQFLMSTGGLRSHYLRYDAPSFLGTRIRFWGRVEYHRELYAPYYGIGNRSSSDLADHPGLSGSHPFAWDRTLPTGRIGFAFPVLDHLRLVTFLGYTHVEVTPYPGSLLAQEQPVGIAGGDDTQAAAGVYYDTRDHEAVPSHGTLWEVTARGSSKHAGSVTTYGGLNGRLLQFFSPHPRTVLAFRVEGDLLSHGTPFWALQSFGGTDTIEGIGGQYSARGIPQNRYIGRLKILGTAEARWRLLERPLFGEDTSLGIVGFVDTGRVWQLDPAVDDGPLPGLHAGYGTGIRIWRRALVLRVDTATSTDRPFSLYFVFGQFF